MSKDSHPTNVEKINNIIAKRDSIKWMLNNTVDCCWLNIEFYMSPSFRPRQTSVNNRHIEQILVEGLQKELNDLNDTIDKINSIDLDNAIK